MRHLPKKINLLWHNFVRLGNFISGNGQILTKTLKVYLEFGKMFMISGTFSLVLKAKC